MQRYLQFKTEMVEKINIIIFYIHSLQLYFPSLLDFSYLFIVLHHFSVFSGSQKLQSEFLLVLH